MKKKLWIVAAISVIVDIISKQLVLKFLKGSSIKLIPGLFSLTYTENAGAAFSILEGKTIMLVVVAVLVIAYLIYITKKKELNNLQTIGYAIFIGGVFGNLIDRLCYGYVIDFLHFYVNGNSFPIFNFADMFIVIGAGLLALDTIKGDKNENSSRKK